METVHGPVHSLGFTLTLFRIGDCLTCDTPWDPKEIGSAKKGQVVDWES